MWHSLYLWTGAWLHTTTETSKIRIRAYILHRSNLNLIRLQEEDDTEDPAIHFGNRDGEDHHPGKEAGQGVDYNKRNVSKHEPNIRAHTTLQYNKQTQKV